MSHPTVVLFIGLGPTELLLVVGLLVLLLGTSRASKITQAGGKALGEFKHEREEVERDLKEIRTDVEADVEDVQTDLKTSTEPIKEELAEAREEVPSLRDSDTTSTKD